MELAELELVPRVEDAPSTAVVTKTTSAVAAPLSIKDAAIAHLRAQEPAIAALAERYREVAFDMSTTKGLAAAKAARLDLRENGRFAIQRGRDATKDLLNDAKKNVEAEAERLIGLVKPVEDNVHAQIEVREAAIKAEKAREEARKKEHADNIALIMGWAQRAHGQPVEKLAGAIVFVEGIDTSEAAYEEFAPAAEKAKADTLEKLRALHAAAVEAARVRAENDRREQVIAALQVITGVVTSCLGRPSSFIQQRIDSLAVSVPSDEEVNTARRNALAQLGALRDAAKLAEDVEAARKAAELAELAKQPPAEPIATPAPAPAPATVVEEPATAPASPAIATAPAAAAQPLPATPLRTVVHKARPLPEDQRLIDAAELAKQFGAEEIGGTWIFGALSDVADLIDAARAA